VHASNPLPYAAPRGVRRVQAKPQVAVPAAKDIVKLALLKMDAQGFAGVVQAGCKLPGNCFFSILC
jgi:hypothetical protein